MASSKIPKLNQRDELIVIIADSRGAGLMEEIGKLPTDGLNVKVLVYPGRGIIQAVKESEKLLIWWRPRQIYIMSGICDITMKNKPTKKVMLRESDVDKSTQSIIDSIDTVSHFIRILMDGYLYRLIFTEIIGMNLATYNNTEYPNPQQKELNMAIEKINAEIVEANSRNNVIAPWIAREVHRNKKDGRKTHRYQKLAEDGLHITGEMRQTWARDYIRAMGRNKLQDTA